MKKPLIILAISLVLAGLCAYLYTLVQPEAENDTLKIRWHAGGGAKGTVTGRVEDIHGKPLANQKFRLYTKENSVDCESDAAGKFSVSLPDPELCAVEVPGSEILKMGMPPSTAEGVTLTVTIR